MGVKRDGALVTGASSGIGAVTACHLKRLGFHVCGTVRSEDDADFMRSAGVFPIRLDVTDSNSIGDAVGEVRSVLGEVPLRAVVNNAGIPCAGPLELIPIEQFRRVLDVNVLGCLAVTQAFLPQLKASAGRIVNISSISARLPLPFLGPYAASKAALEAMTHSLRRELMPFGVGVTIVRPGSIRTRIWDSIENLDVDYLQGSDYDAVARRVQRLAVSGGRDGMNPDVVARAVASALMRSNAPVSMTVVRSRLSSLLSGLLPTIVIDKMIRRRVWADLDVE